MDALLLLAVVVAAIMVGLSVASRTQRSPFSAANASSWRFSFFVIWVLLLPLVLLWEWWGVEVFGFGGLGRKPVTEIPSVPALTYGRKVISDLWAAVAVVLAALAWNKP